MRLVEILASELSEWPTHGVSCIVQDQDLALYEKWGDGPAPLFNDGEWVHVWFAGLDPLLASVLAADYETAIVTREMWWIEKRRLHAEKSMAGELERARAKIHKLNNSYASVEQCKEYLDQSVTWGKADNDPSHNRDRIRAIDVQISELTLERAERIADLAAEGFALLPVVDAVEPAVDMADWRNWEVGDLIECVSHNKQWSEKFELGSISGIKRIDPSDHLPIFIGYHVNPSDFKFHSRPKP
jgi:hypothetical protein